MKRERAENKGPKASIPLNNQHQNKRDATLVRRLSNITIIMGDTHRMSTGAHAFFAVVVQKELATKSFINENSLGAPFTIEINFF